MFDFINNIGNAVRTAIHSNVAKAFIESAESASNNPALANIIGQVENHVLAAAGNVHVPSVIATVAQDLLPSAGVQFSASDLAQAAEGYMTNQPAKATVSLGDAFEAGANWAKAQHIGSIQDGITKAMGAIAPSAPPVLGEVVADVVNIAKDVVEGNTVGAVTEAASDVVHVITELSGAKLPTAEQTTTPNEVPQNA